MTPVGRLRRVLRIDQEVVLPDTYFDDHAGPRNAATRKRVAELLGTLNEVTQFEARTLTSNPAELSEALSAPELAAAARHPWLHRVLLGNAVERAVAQRVSVDGSLGQELTRRTTIQSPRGRPDYAFLQFPGLLADLTTVLGVETHLRRPYGNRLALVLHDYRSRLNNPQLFGLIKEAFEERFGRPFGTSRPGASQRAPERSKDETAPSTMPARAIDVSAPDARTRLSDIAADLEHRTTVDAGRHSDDLRVVIPSSVGRPRSAPLSTAYERARLSLGQAPQFDPDQDGWPRSTERIKLDSAVARADDVTAEETPATSRRTVRAARVSTPASDLGLEIGF